MKSSSDVAWEVLQPLLRQIPDKLECKLIEGVSSESWLPDNVSPMDRHGLTVERFAELHFGEVYVRSMRTIYGNMAERFLSGVMEKFKGQTRATNFVKISGANDYQFTVGNLFFLVELTQTRKTKNDSGKKLSELQKKVPKNHRYTMYMQEDNYISTDGLKVNRRRGSEILLGPDYKYTLDVWNNRVDPETDSAVKKLLEKYHQPVLDRIRDFAKNELNLSS
jgi:hypothetical protein